MSPGIIPQIESSNIQSGYVENRKKKIFFVLCKNLIEFDQLPVNLSITFSQSGSMSKPKGSLTRKILRTTILSYCKTFLETFVLWEFELHRWNPRRNYFKMHTFSKLVNNLFDCSLLV